LYRDGKVLWGDFHLVIVGKNGARTSSMSTPIRMAFILCVHVGQLF
jgi:hypothetical protein